MEDGRAQRHLKSEYYFNRHAVSHDLAVVMRQATDKSPRVPVSLVTFCVVLASWPSCQNGTRVGKPARGQKLDHGRPGVRVEVTSHYDWSPGQSLESVNLCQ